MGGCALGVLYFENYGPTEKFLEIFKDFPHNRCIEKPRKSKSLNCSETLCKRTYN